VKVTRPPLLKVDVSVEVITGGAVEVVCPRLLVVTMKTVLENVVVGLSVGDVLEVLARLVLVGSTEVVEVGVGVEVDVVEGTVLVVVTGVVLVGVLLGGRLEVDGDVVGVGDDVVGTGEELGGVEDDCGDDETDEAGVDPV